MQRAGTAAPRRLRLNWYRGDERPAAGERWQLLARLRQPRGSLNSAGFDYEALAIGHMNLAVKLVAGV